MFVLFKTKKRKEDLMVRPFLPSEQDDYIVKQTVDFFNYSYIALTISGITMFLFGFLLIEVDKSLLQIMGLEKSIISTIAKGMYFFGGIMTIMGLNNLKKKIES